MIYPPNAEPMKAKNSAGIRDSVDMELEYTSLRTEMMSLQQTRFSIIGLTTGTVATLWGWIVANPEQWSWDMAAVLSTSILCVSLYMVWISTRWIALIISYLEFYHSSQWHNKVSIYYSNSKSVRFTSGITSIYFVLYLLAIFISVSIGQESPNDYGIILFCFLTFVYFFLLILFQIRGYNKTQLLAFWAKSR